MYKIVIGNLKGGTGKTTSAVNIAYSMSLMGKQVLVIDADPQTNLTPFFTKANQHSYTIWDMLEKPMKVQRYIYHSRYPGIGIIKGNTAMRETDVISAKWMEAALETVQNDYDYCIIDTRPAFESIAGSAILAADMLLTPVCLDKFCRDNLALVDDFLRELPSELRPEWRVFATKLDPNRRAQRSIYMDLVERHDYPFLDTCISRGAVVDNALEQYKPVMRHRAKSSVSQDYMDLAGEIIEITGDGGKENGEV